MVGARLLIVLVAFGVASAQDRTTFASFGHAVYEKAMKLLKLGQVYLYEDPNGASRENWHGKTWHHGWHHDGEHHGHHGGHHGHWHHKMEEARSCHERCGKDAVCHEKCPKPWAPFVKACQDFPAIQKCRTACHGADCDKCPKFDVEWMNQKFVKNPERATKMAEKKCPILLKAHACHKACGLGDFECHRKCGSMFHHKGWHHHGDHHDDDHHGHHGDRDHGDWHHHGDDHHKQWHGKMRKKMEEARECHVKCGTDAACHSKCPKPWAPIVKACQDFPAIKACHETCKGTACEKCPKFDVDWMNKMFAKAPEYATKIAEEKCPKIEKAHACHKACKPGDFECHHKCPGAGMFHHRNEHRENHHGHWQKLRKMMANAKMCHKKCGKDAQCHSKCPKPFAPFVKACQDFPAIKKCHATCEGEACKECPKFEKEWMNKKMAKFPKRVVKMAEIKCPMILKAHACHQACKPGDFECHHKCPSMFHGHHGHHHRMEESVQKPPTREVVETDPILI